MIQDEFFHNPITLFHIASELRTRGVSPLDLFKRLSLSPAELLGNHVWLPRALCFQLGDEAAKAIGDSFFGRRVGESHRLDDFGLWGQTILQAQSVRDACIAACCGVELLHQGTDLQLLDNNSRAELRFAYRGRLHNDPRQHVVGTLAVLRKIALLAGKPEAVAVHFSIPYERSAGSLEESHGSRLEFGCAHDAIVIDRDILDLPLGKSAVIRRGNASTHFETALDVEATIMELLPYRRATIDGVAARQGVSRRTLQRCLGDIGFTFEEILDETRRLEALKALRTCQKPIGEIAFLLGYADAAHFTRAFRRWTGQTPRAYYRACQGEA